MFDWNLTPIVFSGHPASVKLKVIHISETEAVKVLINKILFVTAVMFASSFTKAQNIMGPVQIINVTTTIATNTGYSISDIADGITVNMNGYAGDTKALGSIFFTFDKSYDLNSSYLWNDVNVQAEGVKTYKFNFFDPFNNLVGTTGIFSVTAGQVAAHIEGLSANNVKTVEMVVLSLLPPPFNQPQLERVEIREVAFSGNPSLLPTDVLGEHYQCYRVTGRKLSPLSFKIADQFGKSQIVLGKPVLLCNPSAKFHNNKMYIPLSPDVHQVCYEIVRRSKSPSSRKVQISNQFNTSQMTVLTPLEMFCVPSQKILLRSKKYDLSDFILNP